jgi:hypothetical protein
MSKPIRATFREGNPSVSRQGRNEVDGEAAYNPSAYQIATPW